MIDIVIPVLARPTNAHKVARSIHQATVQEHRIFFICSQGDTNEIKACQATGENILIADWPAGKADFARKINWAFPQTDAPWVFQGADDLRFHENWDVYAVRVGDHRKVGVVGTDDMGNALVKRGAHSTHTLIRRSYITEFGGTFDNTGLVFCELYDHQYCDNEFVQTAIMRGQWAFSKRSQVEHLHPAWSKGGEDATYRKAVRATKSDHALFMRRNAIIRRRRRSVRMSQRYTAF